MSDIKMSDVFQLPVSCEEVSEIGVELFDNNEDAYAAFAINNHDRLTEENAQLKADNFDLLREQKRLQSMLYDALRCTGYFDAVKKGVYQIQPVRIYPQETKGN